jgi:hypothetical protein
MLEIHHCYYRYFYLKSKEKVPTFGGGCLQAKQRAGAYLIVGLS